MELFTKAAFEASINIFAHTGKFIRDMTQCFGYRGKMDNNNRLTAQSTRAEFSAPK